MHKNHIFKASIATLGILFTSICSMQLVYAEEEVPLAVKVISNHRSYEWDDRLTVSWTPASTPIGGVNLIPVKNSEMSYYLHNGDYYGDESMNGSEGSASYGFPGHVPSGYYYIQIISTGTTSEIAYSKKPIKYINLPNITLGDEFDRFSSVALFSEEGTVGLKWEATDTKKCQARSEPSNNGWDGLVAPFGVKKIRVATTTVFFLRCTNQTGSVSERFLVQTDIPERTSAKLISSTSSITTNFDFASTREGVIPVEKLQDELFSKAIVPFALYNSSAVDPIYYQVTSNNKPAWLQASTGESQYVLEPLKMDSWWSVYTDPREVAQPGTYTWDMKFEGNFSNSPLVIPVTMNVLP